MKRLQPLQESCFGRFARNVTLVLRNILHAVLFCRCWRDIWARASPQSSSQIGRDSNTSFYRVWVREPELLSVFFWTPESALLAFLTDQTQRCKRSVARFVDASSPSMHTGTSECFFFQESVRVSALWNVTANMWSLVWIINVLGIKIL